MLLKETLLMRSKGMCELCEGNENLEMYEVPPEDTAHEENTVIACQKCLAQIEKRAELNLEYWQNILPSSMWSEVVPVQVVSWRMLNRFRNESWAADNIEMMYFNEDVLNWAKATGDHENDPSVDFHRDTNGAILQNGDSVVLTRSLDVKGTSLNAKMGTAVRNIRLVPGNTGQIEGRVDNQLIVILTKYVRKQG